MDRQFFEIGGRVFTVEEAGVAGVAAVLLILLLTAIGAWRRAARSAEHGEAVEARVAELVRAQSEMSGRMQTRFSAPVSRTSSAASPNGWTVSATASASR